MVGLGRGRSGVVWGRGQAAVGEDRAHNTAAALPWATLLADSNLLLGRPRLAVADTPSAGPHRLGRCSLLRGIAIAVFSMVPQVGSRENTV